MNYEESGVSINNACSWSKKLSVKAKKTYTKNVISGIGGFGGLFRIDTKKYKKPVLVSGIDGVGSKLKIAFYYKNTYPTGIDLVAMNVNDILTYGACPLFFLDYLGVGSLKNDLLNNFIDGIIEGCKEAGCTFIGGETAQLPDFYAENEFDAAGTAVGVVEEDKIIDGKNVKEEDILIGIASSGVHSNGFTLIRKVLPWKEDKRIADILLTPTKIYVKTILNLIKKGKQIKAMAHITGGGLYNNIIRVVPNGLDVEIEYGKWEMPEIFKLIQRHGKIEDKEMYKVFNMGIGFVIITSYSESQNILKDLKDNGEKAWIIGKIKKRKS